MRNTVKDTANTQRHAQTVGGAPRGEGVAAAVQSRKRGSECARVSAADSHRRGAQHPIAHRTPLRERRLTNDLCQTFAISSGLSTCRVLTLRDADAAAEPPRRALVLYRERTTQSVLRTPPCDWKRHGCRSGAQIDVRRRARSPKGNHWFRRTCSAARSAVKCRYAAQWGGPEIGGTVLTSAISPCIRLAGTRAVARGERIALTVHRWRANTHAVSVVNELRARSPRRDRWWGKRRATRKSRVRSVPFRDESPSRVARYP